VSTTGARIVWASERRRDNSHESPQLCAKGRGQTLRRSKKPSRAVTLRRMTRAEKAEKILAILDELYPAPPIPLDHEDPFSLLIAVLLSAQTTDAQVNKVTPAQPFWQQGAA